MHNNVYKYILLTSLYTTAAMADITVSSNDAETKKFPAQTPDIISNANPTSSTEMNKMSTNHPELSTFILLVNSSQLKDLFNGTGPFTVFAPTNEAFEKLGKDKIEALKKPENGDELSDILMHHFVTGKYLSKNLKSTELPTLTGKKVSIDVDHDQIRVNGKKVVKVDLVGPNGVIHIIDGVITN